MLAVQLIDLEGPCPGHRDWAGAFVMCYVYCVSLRLSDQAAAFLGWVSRETMTTVMAAGIRQKREVGK